jgi:Zn-dependent M28 family amino/carboxypeptidase
MRRCKLYILLLWLLMICSQRLYAVNLAGAMADIQQLSDARMAGRKTGSDGAALAAEYISQRFHELGLTPFTQGYLQSFRYGSFDKTGINVVAHLRGCQYAQSYIVITAHYDHLGLEGRKIFHGADDNASGVAALLALATRLTEQCPAYSYIFLATDAEESGLYGSKAFVAAPTVPLNSIVLNLNLDMVSHADRRGRLYLTGAKRYPALIAKLNATYDKIRFLSHSGPGKFGRDHRHYDWPNASDHGPFYRAGIPYLFFGGQDHAQYHTEEDQWQRIDTEFLNMALQAIWTTVLWLEQQEPATLAVQ